MLTVFGACAGCGASHSGAADSTDQAPASSAAVAQTRDTVNLCFTQSFVSMDPHNSVAATDLAVHAQVFELLIFVDQDGTEFPHVAKKYAFAPDGLSVTFTLREGVTFHNGDALTADDVTFPLERALASSYMLTKV